MNSSTHFFCLASSGSGAEESEKAKEMHPHFHKNNGNASISGGDEVCRDYYDDNKQQ